MAGEEPLLLELEHALLGRRQPLRELARELLVLLGELRQRLELLDVGGEAAVALQAPRQPRVLGPDRGRAVGVIPEAGLPHLRLERGHALGKRSGVKDSPRGARAARGSPQGVPASVLRRVRCSCAVAALELLARAAPAGVVAAELLVA